MFALHAAPVISGVLWTWRVNNTHHARLVSRVMLFSRGYNIPPKGKLASKHPDCLNFVRPQWQIETKWPVSCPFFGFSLKSQKKFRAVGIFRLCLRACADFITVLQSGMRPSYEKLTTHQKWKQDHLNLTLGSLFYIFAPLYRKFNIKYEMEAQTMNFFQIRVSQAPFQFFELPKAT